MARCTIFMRRLDHWRQNRACFIAQADEQLRLRDVVAVWCNLVLRCNI
jgi:hypothetical protein